MSNGVIYLCTKSTRHLKECYYSVKTLKKHNPALNVTLFTDIQSFNRNLFNQVIPVNYDCNPHKQKILCLLKSPFKNTLYLDVDTKIEGDLSPIFHELSDSDLMISHDPDIVYKVKPPLFKGYIRKGHFNTGVIAYCKTRNTSDFLDFWLKDAMTQPDDDMWPGHFGDQYYFDKNIYKYIDQNPDFKFKIMDNRLYNVVRWMYEYMDREERETIIIKHWHNLHYNVFQWKARSLFDFLINSVRDFTK